MRLFAGTPFDRPPRCESCDRPEAECVCPPEAPVRCPPSQQTARVRVEKRKKGKLVTVVSGLSPDDNDLAALLTKLKTTCGAGGTLRDDLLEIQGDHRDRIASLLRELGYRVRN